jgi:hypothetical protein
MAITSLMSRRDASLNHNFFVSEMTIFSSSELDPSGKTGGGFSVFARRVVPTDALPRRDATGTMSLEGRRPAAISHTEAAWIVSMQ